MYMIDIYVFYVTRVHSICEVLVHSADGLHTPMEYYRKRMYTVPVNAIIDAVYYCIKSILPLAIYAMLLRYSIRR